MIFIIFLDSINDFYYFFRFRKWFLLSAYTVVLLSSFQLSSFQLSSFQLSSNTSRKQHQLHHSYCSYPTLCRNYNHQCFSRLRYTSKFHKKKLLELDQTMSCCKTVWHGNSPADGRLHLPEKIVFFLNLWRKCLFYHIGFKLYVLFFEKIGIRHKLVRMCCTNLLHKHFLPLGCCLQSVPLQNN